MPEPTEALSPTEPTSTPATSGPTPAVPRALRLGVAGPVGTGKSSLIALLCRELGHRLSVAVVTNDIYTDEDARFLRSAGVLDPERIRAVETGACPHTAIRDDVSQNLLAVEDLEHDFAPVDLVLVESGGDNLTATFSPALVDAQFFVLDVAGGGDVARKGGPGIARADVLVVNKTDLAPHVGVDVAAMVQDAGRARAGGRVIALSRTDPGSVAELREWVLATLARFRSGGLVPVDPGPMAPHTHAGDEHSHAEHEHEHEHSHADGEHEHSHADGEHEHSHADGEHEHSHGHGDREARHSAAAGGEARGEPSGR